MRLTKLIAMFLIIASLGAVTTYLYTHKILLSSTGFAGLDKWRQSRVNIYANDFGQLAHYKAQNKSDVEKGQVVFFGDSIIEYWILANNFSNKPYLNRGIAGQTTSQMLVRFHQDVIELKPKVVVILASNNDIAGNTGVMQIEDILSNYATMAEVAHDNNIKVIFLSMLPVHNYTPESQELFAQRPLSKIQEINLRLKKYALSNGHVFVDIHTPMLDDAGLLRKELASDGLHPNDDAYALISLLVQSAIDKALITAETKPTETHRSVAD